ncbi:MAG: tryptophan synthase subunit alpha [Firmicutes bacterium]|nr:tryptophan synthase subunit alpha [Candidatus Colivicinus equi]
MKFIGYIPFGYPSIKESIDIISSYCETGCTAIEASFPLQNPIGESEMITNYMRYALSKNDNYDDYLEGISQVRRLFPELEINLLLFVEVMLKIGKDKIAQFCKKERIGSIICPNISSHMDFQEEMSEKGLMFIAPFHYDVDDAELQNCINAKGFIYMQAFPPEWQKVKPGFETPDVIIKYLRDNGVKNDIYAGVGIKNFEDVEIIKRAGADGFFVGSTLMKLMDDPEALKKKVSEFIRIGK